MARPPRICPAGMIFHVLNRATARRVIFFDSGDYAAFERILGASVIRSPVGLPAYCWMPNHRHLIVRPREDGALSWFM